MGKNLQVLVGCDPEVFVSVKGKKNSNIISAHGIIPGTKYDPHKILEGMVQVDGCALEFGIDPARTYSEWYNRIHQVMTQLKDMVPGHNIHIQPVADFEPKYFEKEVPEQAKMLGCEPDWNAWTGDINPPPDVTNFPNMRTAAGHIHVGWCKGKDPFDKNHMDDCKLVVKQLDYYVGIFSLIWDQDNRRRNLYGKAGAFRPKPYGCEYRVPSNMWLSGPALIDWVYFSVRQAIHDLSAGVTPEKQYKELAREIIDNNQTDWKKRKILNSTYHPQSRVEFYTENKHMRGPTYSNV